MCVELNRDSIVGYSQLFTSNGEVKCIYQLAEITYLKGKGAILQSEAFSDSTIENLAKEDHRYNIT